MCGKLLWSLVLFGSYAAQAQSGWNAMADLNLVNAFSRIHGDIFSPAVNPASLAAAKNGGISVSGERKFLLPELSAYEVRGGLITSSGNFGLGIQMTGTDLFKETRTGLSYARKLSDQLEAGAEIHFVSISMGGYGKVSVPGFGLGLLLHPNEKLHIGLSTQDPISRSFGKEGEGSLPYLYTMGVGFEPSRNFLLAFLVHKEESRPVEASAVIQYFPLDLVCVRAGMSLFNQTAGLALGWQRSIDAAKLKIFISTQYHFQLGITPGIQVQYSFSKKQQ
jgi:hypothetical protein